MYYTADMSFNINTEKFFNENKETISPNMRSIIDVLKKLKTIETTYEYDSDEMPELEPVDYCEYDEMPELEPVDDCEYDEPLSLKEIQDCPDQIMADKIIKIKNKFENIKMSKLTIKQDLMKELEKIGSEIDNINEHESIEIKSVMKHAQEEKDRNNEDYVIEQLEPLMNSKEFQLGMAIATLLRLGKYTSRYELIRKETQKTGAYIRDRVQDRIIESARDALRDRLMLGLGSFGIVESGESAAPDLFDTYITDSYDIIDSTGNLI